MRIKELLLKNFGKFTDRKIMLSEGIHIIYGENESGKSTIHTFIRSMLFGMERGRGRAAANDTFSLYAPWENPNYYSGRLRFEAGGRNFVIERNFDKYGKKVTVVCEDDGEELSVEAGDLEMILDGLTSGDYDDTVSIGQFRVQPGGALASELKNYATNYYVTGDSDLNLDAAVARLGERKKEAERSIKNIIDKKQEERSKLEQEASYIWRDIHRIRQEQENLEEEIAYRKKCEEQKEEEAKHRKIDEMRPKKWRIHPLEIIVFAVVNVISFVLIPRPWNFFTTTVLFLLCLIYVWNRMKVGKQEEKTEPELLLEEIAQVSGGEEPLEHLIWERERNAEELRDKQVQYGNIREQLSELDEIGDEYKGYERQKQAVMQAIRKIEELSVNLQEKMKEELNSHTSRIISEITEGRYTRLLVGEGLSLHLLCDGRKIPVTQVSRGTAEQVYFALRMAAGELLYQEEYPVILDDTFAYYDEKRLEQTLRWLYKNKKQVIIFTCQRREEEALVRMGIPYVKEILLTV